MAASISLRSKLAVINRSLLSQKCVLCTQKKSCATVSDEKNDSHLDKTHKPQRLGYWVPLDALGVKVHPEEKEKLDKYFSRNKDNKKYDVFQEVPQKPIAGNSTILVKGNGKTPIAIPKKKKRDSLSVLKALASTVGTDPSAPHYSFIDDPYLMPTFRNQEVCLMAKASGKRAAQYFVNKHSDLFGHNDARPHIPGFQPRAKGYNVIDVGEKALMERVDRRAVRHAVEVYDRMSEQGLKLSQEGMMRLLELLCAYQCQDPVHDIFPEERLAQPDNTTTSKHMDKAMEVFEGIETRTADTYNWIIRGLAQAGDSRCWTLFEEMEVEEFTADLGTFNDLLNQMGREASTNRSFDEVKNVLKKMTAEGVQPDLETFHGMLRFLKCLMPKDGYLGNKVVANVRQVLAEMRELDIEPSLETWSLVLDTLIVMNKESGFWSTVQRNHEPAKDILEIVEYLKKQSPEKVVMDHLGENFFTKAMSYLSRRYIVEAAKVLFELRESMGLRYVTTDLHMENNYYEAFFLLLIKEETLEVAMDYYVKYIRNGRLTSSTNYTRFRLYKEIYNNNAYHWIPLIYADQSAAGSARFLMLGEEIMEMMSRKDVPPELHHDFETIADEFLERNKQVFNVFNDVKRPHIVMSYHIRIYVNLGQLQKAWDVVKVYTSRTQFLGYDLMPLVLKELLEKTAENLEFELLMYLVEMDANYRPMFVKPMEELLVTYGDLLETNLTKTKMDELRAFIKKSQF